MPNIRKIGNSYGVIIPNTILSNLELGLHDEVEIFTEGKNIKIKKINNKEDILRSWFKNGPMKNRDDLLEFKEDDNIW
ncbi:MULTISPECIES: AbrB/MazE/SpoVT family DNA-binding domain-containing protein [Fusobacterium]|uniref:AbrB/MazE/SpoVT family DNA-binding domain-containing protein n=1 Tax=Fusobacterium TaxID=848 RepID=UPI0026719A80|nr:AbrB/MazE/SpoVT family DNA-binding domain-containing protein [Fusobacterium ulcerans]